MLLVADNNWWFYVTVKVQTKFCQHYIKLKLRYNRKLEAKRTSENKVQWKFSLSRKFSWAVIMITCYTFNPQISAHTSQVSFSACGRETRFGCCGARGKPAGVCSKFIGANLVPSITFIQVMSNKPMIRCHYKQFNLKSLPFFNKPATHFRSVTISLYASSPNLRVSMNDRKVEATLLTKCTSKL